MFPFRLSSSYFVIYIIYHDAFQCVCIHDSLRYNRPRFLRTRNLDNTDLFIVYQLLINACKYYIQDPYSESPTSVHLDLGFHWRSPILRRILAHQRRKRIFYKYFFAQNYNYCSLTHRFSLADNVAKRSFRSVVLSKRVREHAGVKGKEIFSRLAAADKSYNTNYLIQKFPLILHIQRPRRLRGRGRNVVF